MFDFGLSFSDCTVIPYIGSKQRLYSFLPHGLPPHERYIEPFGGGFSLGLYLKSLGVAHGCHYNDISPTLYDFWRSLKEDAWYFAERVMYYYDFLTEHLTQLEDFSWNLRVSASGGGTFSLSESDLLMFTNDHFDRGAIRYLINSVGRGNSTSGITLHSLGSLNLGSQRADKFIRVGLALQDVEISNENVFNLKYLDSPMTFWYLDPPYYSLEYKGFYTDGDAFDHVALRDFLSTLQGSFLMSYDDTSEIRSLYKDFYVYPIKLFSRLSRQQTNELLITNTPHFSYLANF